MKGKHNIWPARSMQNSVRTGRTFNLPANTKERGRTWGPGSKANGSCRDERDIHEFFRNGLIVFKPVSHGAKS